MKKIIFILFLFTTGCMKYTDLSDLQIIKSIGISYNSNYTLYAEIYDEIKKDNEPKTKIISASGKTIDEAFKNISLISNKEIFLSHIDLLILSCELKENNYQEIIKYFINSKELRNDFLCIFSENINDLLNNSRYDEIEEIIKSNNEVKKTINISFDEIINDYLNNSTFTLSMINYNKNIEYQGNYKYINNHLERINNEKD